MFEIIRRLKNELSKVVVGQDEMVDALLVGILSKGHVLLEGVPGIAKTTTVNTLSYALGLNFKRIQFTPDLLPSDVIGAEIYDPKTNEFKIKHGPIFTNLLLADEINRAPAKVQSALLEVMQEKQVTIGENSFKIDTPFFVLATQNPIEQEGVYSLPEAQLDRFMLKVNVDYGTKEEELEIARRVANSSFETVESVVSKEEIFSLQEEVSKIHIDPELEEYIVDLIYKTREENPYLKYGASPRATIDLLKASKAYAFLAEKDFVAPSDIAKACKSVLRHRLVLSYEAQAEEIQPDDIIKDIIANVPVP
ncbi:MAG: MoxR family ATPase [Campylobacterales bacterium]|nr:MoxR family ATPase [Campylobacterales bacterium]